MASGRSVLLLAQPTSGGVARHVVDLASGLVERGWRVEVGCPRGGNLASRLVAKKITPRALALARSITPLGDARSLVATRTLIQEQSPDIVHAHSSKAGFIGRLAARTLGIRHTVYTPHCLAFVGRTGIEAVACRLAERMAAGWTERFIVVAEAEADVIAAAGLAPPARVRRVYNGIDVLALVADGASRATLRQTWGVDDGEGGCVFSIVGRADRQKAFDVFVEAAIAAAPRAPRAKFALVGGDYTTAGALDSLARRVREADLEDRFLMLGERDDVSAILAASDALVMPSRWEAFPYAVLEAGAHGLPVIATPVGGLPEVVQGGTSGLMVPIDDPAALAQAMVRLSCDPSLRSSMGARLKERVAGFTLDRMVDETVAVYEELLA